MTVRLTIPLVGEETRAALLWGGHIVWNEEDQVYDLTEHGEAWLKEWCRRELEETR